MSMLEGPVGSATQKHGIRYSYYTLHCKCEVCRAWKRRTGGTSHNGPTSKRTSVPVPVPAKAPREVSGALQMLLDRNGLTVEDIGKIKVYQGFIKTPEGEIETVDLFSLSPKFEEGPDWPVIQPAAPTTVRARHTPASQVRTGFKTAVVLPDPQIGFRRDANTGALDPFHDELAMSVAMQILASVKPDLIINLGDILDLAEFSRFEIEQSFATTTQAALDRAHLFLAEQRATAPDADIRLLEGNHDRRLYKSIVANAKAAFGLKQACSTPDKWPVMAIPNLLRLDELNVEYIEGYPAGMTYINDRLACVHGERLKVSQVVDDERVSVIQGHIHRIEVKHKTRRVRGGSKTLMAASPGCLCRVDGTVPSTKGSTDSYGHAIMRPEDWQQGFCVVSYMPDDGPFHVEIVPIHEGMAIFRGKEFVAA